MQYDVLVVGAGFSGLAAGIRASLHGKRVLLVEKHSAWGGLNSFYVKDGHCFDTGLHAVTNWVRPGYAGPRLPLQFVSRQLRIDPGAFELDPQTRSRIVFPGAELTFTNDFGHLEAEVARSFPRSINGFRTLAAQCEGHTDIIGGTPRRPARPILRGLLRDDLLVEMLLFPTLYYGGAAEHDLDYDDFGMMFRSIFREGLCRPHRGVRALLDVLIHRARDVGLAVRRRCGVRSLRVCDGRVVGVELDDGESVEAELVISSIGRFETERLRSDRSADVEPAGLGQLTVFETLWVLDCEPRNLGIDDCVVFFCDECTARWARPATPIDVMGGVLAAPGNFAHAEPVTPPLLRSTHLANPAFWLSASAEDYTVEKARSIERSMAVASRYAADLAGHVEYTDAFTPRTLRQYAGHLNGAIYGTPEKARDGRTGLANLFLCGTDQGLVGIVGAMASGIGIANACLSTHRARRPS